MVARYVLERWLPIPGYEGYYEVSNLGQIRSLDRIIHYLDGRKVLKKGIMIKQSYDGDRYLQIALTKERKRRDVCTHIVVCETFHGPKPTPKHEVAHNDGTRTNNRWDNLRWDLHIGNQHDKFKHGTITRGSMVKKSNLVDDDVRDIRRLLKEGVTGVELAKRYKVTEGAIREIRHRRSWAWLED